MCLSFSVIVTVRISSRRFFCYAIYVYTVSQKNVPLIWSLIYILNKSTKNEQILIILDEQYAGEVSHQKIVNAPTSLE